VYQLVTTQAGTALAATGAMATAYLAATSRDVGRSRVQHIDSAPVGA
jgi:hypothetical protein